MSDASPFSSKLSKSKQNVDMQEGHLVSEGHISNEHDAYSNEHDAYSSKPEEESSLYRDALRWVFSR
jgi:hypothetical protein